MTIFLGKVGDYITNTVIRAIAKVAFPGYKTKDELRGEEIEGLRRMIDGLTATVHENEELRHRKGNPDRATEIFVSDAVESALATPFAAKQLILGRLVGERLESGTESRDDLFLRESLRIVREANQAQLFAVATLYLVHHPPESLMPIESLAAWWDAEYLPLLAKLVTDWNTDDLEYLERLGALTIDNLANSDVIRASQRGGPPIDGVLMRRGFGPADSLSSDPHQKSDFAIYTSRLYGGRAGTTAWPDPGFALSSYHLTTPGMHVALTIVDALSKHPIKAASNATMYPF